MTLLLALCVTVIFAVSIYLILGRELKEVAMGVFLLGHAANLAILAVSGQPILPTGAIKVPPVLGASNASLVDPVPQALILTAIVISFAVMAFLLTLLVMTHRSADALDINKLANMDEPATSSDL